MLLLSNSSGVFIENPSRRNLKCDRAFIYNTFFHVVYEKLRNKNKHGGTVQILEMAYKKQNTRQLAGNNMSAKVQKVTSSHLKKHILNICQFYFQKTV